MTDVRILSERTIDARRFGAWSMTARMAPAALRTGAIEAVSAAEMEAFLLEAAR